MRAPGHGERPDLPHVARELLARIALGAVPVLDGPGGCVVRAVDSVLCADGARPDVRGVVAAAGAVPASRLGVWRGELRADLGCPAALGVTVRPGATARG
jgi:hypothetical protein